MTTRQPDDRIVADVKCYYCGHVSGQLIRRRGESPKGGRFVPRPGYRGPEVRPGMRLRCERCRGPVFLEDVTPLARAESMLARGLRPPASSAKKAA